MSDTPATADARDSGLAAKDPAKRRRTLLLVATIFLLIAVIWFALWKLVFSVREQTDNAYVGGNVVAISAQVPGTVIAVLADDTQHVTAGEPLVRLDPTDADVRLRQAASALALAVRQVRGQTDSAAGADAAVAARKVELDKAQADLKRHLPLVAAQAESPEIVQHLRDAVAGAQAAFAAAQAQAQAAHAAIAGTAVADNPLVAQARATFRAAWIAAQRNTIVAPVAGYVAERSVQLGASIAPGQPLLSVVPLHDLWVDANFKENQLRHIRIGQPATITTDLYGDRVSYRGKVVGLGAGTGSVFSLLPAQNATGNWIKVVQRVPVRIALDNRQLDAHPLRVGLSAAVTVDIRHTDGKLLAAGPARPAAETSVYDHVAHAADAEADQIIAANLGPAARAR
ncbi:MAG: HlyD family efflux transporter periplasmic adaptor subunit [Rhodanobacter sp.]|nr:MAG: HlyD family efflux transporter periplasmic adaptor subunit [Rhodanobacter sp.]TAM10346.1 MAG: HlyD family efflux transporter periplasmic adaptor subunit [Rhodanobacter sp.]TAM34444.1 MAG: HlyD family efflux transporter periplasmic adaptor subunit [Rhodanobacter sp.]